MSYITRQGDTWDGIAFLVYGNESMMPLLMNSNLAHAHTTIFSAGVSLTLPDNQQQASVSSTLPPWKQGGEA